QRVGGEDLVLDDGTGGVDVVYVHRPPAVLATLDVGDLVLRRDGHQTGGLGLRDVGDVDGVLAAVVDTHRARPVGVGRGHLAAEFGERVVPVDRHRDLVDREAGLPHTVGEDA